MSTINSPGFVATLSELPPSLRDEVGDFEIAQRDGAESIGEATDLTRRYTLANGAIYFPEVGRSMSPRTILALVLAAGGLAALVSGVSIRLSGISWASWIAIAGAVMAVASLGVIAGATRGDLARRARVEHLGLYLLADSMILWRRKGLSIFPRASIVELAAVSPAAGSAMKKHVVRYRDANGELASSEIIVGHRDALRDLMQGWLRGAD